jgi:hypothetical protein
MAFNTSAESPKLAEVIGSFAPIAYGIDSTAGGGTCTVTVPSLKTVKGVIVTPQAAATAIPYVSATSGNTFTVTMDASEAFSWMAWGDPAA